MAAGLGLLLCGAGVTFLIYRLWDEPVRLWLMAHPNTWHQQDWVNAFRQLGKACVPIWLVLLWSCLTNRWRPTVLTLAALSFVALSVCPLKVLVARQRPNDPTLAATTSSASSAHPAWERNVSFPSGDTAAVFAVATVLVFSIRRAWSLLFLPVAGAVGVLRVTSLAHYPSDAFAGMLIGVLVGWWVVHRVIHWLPRREFALGGWWRILLGVLLLILIPWLSPLVGMKPLPVFLRFYGPAVLGLLLLGTRIPLRR